MLSAEAKKMQDEAFEQWQELYAYCHDGRSPVELMDAVRQVVAEVQRTHKKGSLKLTLTVSPRNKNPDSEEVVVSDSIEVKLPRLDRAEAIFFANDAGELARDPFQQQAIPFAPVEAATGG